MVSSLLELGFSLSLMPLRFTNLLSLRIGGWHHQFDGYEFDQAPGIGDGQGSLTLLQSVASQRAGQTELLN